MNLLKHIFNKCFIHLQDLIILYTNIIFKNSYAINKLYNPNIHNINWASKYGHLEVVQYLNFIGKTCTEDAMNEARGNGHLEVVKYLKTLV